MVLPLLIALGSALPSPAPMPQHEEGAPVPRLPVKLLEPQSVEEGKRYPLILFLHGAGERGSDGELQMKHFPERMLTPERQSEFPCYILAPQCPEGGRWTTDDWRSKTSRVMPQAMTEPMQGVVDALLETVREHPVDLDRIYLTGLSMGGYGTFELSQRFPDWFAAVAPVCGGGDETHADRLVGVPLSIWHGDADDAVPVENSRAMKKALDELTIEAEYHELPGVGHNAWDTAYGDEGCLEWMFRQRRDPERRAREAGRIMAESLRADERLCFLGDSITQQGAQPGGYVELLGEEFRKARPGGTLIPAGISGHKVPDLLAREKADVRDKGATLVFVYIGINDVWHSQSGKGTPPDDYGAGLTKLLQTFESGGDGASEAKATVVLATPTVIGEQGAGQNPLDSMLTDYAALSRSVARAGGRQVCDLHLAFRDHLRLFNPEDKIAGILTGDGVHLTEEGNWLVAAEAALAIRRAALSRKETESK